MFTDPPDNWPSHALNSATYDIERHPMKGNFAGWDKALLEGQVKSLALAAEAADDQNQENLWALHDALVAVLAEND